MPRYSLNGKTYNIPDSLTAEFEKDMPEATLAYRNGNDVYDIPVSKKFGFLSKFPDAVLYEEEKPAEVEQNAKVKQDAKVGQDAKAGEDAMLVRPEGRTLWERMASLPSSIDVMPLPPENVMPLPSMEEEGDKKQNEAELKRERNRQFSSYIDGQRGEINREIRSVIADINRKEEKFRSEHPFVHALSHAGQGMTGGRNFDPYGKDARMRNLSAASNLLDDSEKMLKEARADKSSGLRNFGRGLKDGAFDVGTWTMGITGMQHDSSLLLALDKVNRGEALSSDEQKLLDAYVVHMATSAFTASDMSRGYKAGQTTANSIPFMLEMAFNPVSRSGNEIAKGLLKYGLKRFGRAAAEKTAEGAGKGALNAFGKAIASKGGKVIGRLAGDAAAAAGMTATTGIGRVAEGTFERLNDNYSPDVDKDGNAVVEKTGDMGVGEAFAKSATSTFLENQSEMVFNAFKGGGKMAKEWIVKTFPTLMKLTDSQLAKVVGKMWNNPTLKKVKDRTQVHGVFEEYAEEVYNNLANVPLGETTWEDVTSANQNIDTFLGLVPMQVAFGAIGLGGMARESYATRKRLKNFREGLANDNERALFEELEKAVKMPEGEKTAKAFIKRTLADDELTESQKHDRIFAAADMVRERKLQNAEREMPPMSPEEIEAGKVDIYRNYVRSRRELESTPLPEELKEDIDKWDMGSIADNFDLDKRQLDAVSAYKDASRRYAEYQADATRRMENEKEVARMQAEKDVERAGNPDTGMVTQAKHKFTDSPVSIVGGRLAFGENGLPDREQSDDTVYYINDKGERKPAPADDFEGIISDVPMDDYVSQATRNAEEDFMRAEQASLQSPDIPVPEQGVTFRKDGAEYAIENSTPDGGFLAYKLDETGEIDRKGGEAAVEISPSEYYQYKEAEMWGTPVEKAQTTDNTPEDEAENGDSPSKGEGNLPNSGGADAQAESVSGKSEDRSERKIEELKATLPRKGKNGEIDYKKMSPQQRYEYTSLTESPETAAEDLRGDVEMKRSKLEKMNERLGKATEGERVEMRDAIREKKRELEELEGFYRKAVPAEPAGNADEVTDAATRNEAPEQETGMPEEKAGAHSAIPESVRNDEEYVEWVAENSDDAGEVLGAYSAAKEMASHENTLKRWERELLGRKVRPSSFNRFGDRNHITGAMAKGWLRKDGEEIDTLAQELSELGGVEVTEQDIVDFMLAHPSNRVSERSEVMRNLGRRFSEIASREMGFPVGNPDSNTGRLYVRMKEAEEKPTELTERQKQEMRNAVEADMNEAVERQTLQHESEFSEEDAEAYNEARRWMDEELADSESGQQPDENGEGAGTGNGESELNGDGNLPYLQGKEDAEIERKDRPALYDGMTAEELDEIYSNLQYESYGTERLENYQEDYGAENDEAGLRETISEGEASEDSGVFPEDDGDLRQEDSGTERRANGGYRAEGSEPDVETGDNVLNNGGELPPLQGEEKTANDDAILEPVSQGERRAETPQDSRMAEAADRLRQRSRTHESSDGGSGKALSLQEKINREARKAESYAKESGQWIPMSKVGSDLSDEVQGLDAPATMNPSEQEHGSNPQSSLTPSADKGSVSPEKKQEGGKFVAPKMNPSENIFDYAERVAKKKEADQSLPAFEKSPTARDSGVQDAAISSNPMSGNSPQTASYADKGSIPTEEKQAERTFVASRMNPGENIFDYAERVAKEKEMDNVRRSVNTEPSEAQKEAGNYRKGHVKVDSYDVTIENPKGSERKGTDKDGHAWQVSMNNDYGYIRDTEGADGDHIDVFLSDNPSDGNVYVVDQLKEDGAFDEHKVMYGFDSADEAREAYLANYSPGWKGLGTISEVSKDEFKKWVKSSHRKTKPFAEYKGVRIDGAQTADYDTMQTNATEREVLNTNSTESDADNTDTDNGIRFREVDAEGRKTLVGIHNISEEKFRKAMRLGGFANPSAAVIDLDKQSHDGYGEISLLLPSSMVDKKKGRNAGTFSGDAWTPVYPQVERKFSGKGGDAASRDISSVPQEMQSEVRRNIDSWMDGRSSDTGLAYLYLYEQGKAPELVRIEAKYPETLHKDVKMILGNRQGLYDLSNEERRQMLDLLIRERYEGNEQAYQDDLQEKMSRLEEKINSRHPNSLVAKRGREDLEDMRAKGYDYGQLSDFVDEVQTDAEYAGTVNDAKTAMNSKEYIEEHGLGKDFANWKERLSDRYEIEEVIFDGFTPSGNRRYLPNTLDNASKFMKKQGRAGATGSNASFSNFAAGLMKAKSTLKDIRTEKDKLTSDHTDVDAFRDKWSQVFFELGEKLQPDAEGYEDYGLARLSEAATKSNPKQYIKNEYGIDFSDEDVEKLHEMVTAIRNEYPTMYFETKFERPVYLNEFAAAVVPDNVSEDVIKHIKDAGLEVVTYKYGDSADRKRALEEAATKDVRFRQADIEAVNERFNKELNGLTEENADKVVFDLGMPSDVLLSAGVQDKPMKLYGNKVIKKMKKHGFKLEELRNLPHAVSDPIAVFDNYRKENNRSILTKLRTRQGNFLVSVNVGKDADIDFNIVRSVFGKGDDNVVDWINKGLATYINKEKALSFLSHQSALSAVTAANEGLESSDYPHHSALKAVTSDNQKLSDATKIVENFENPSIETEVQRKGEGSYSDTEVSYAHDPVGKMTGKPTHSKKEQVAFAERERQRMEAHVRSLAEKLHLNDVEIVTDRSTLKGEKAEAKGFYDTRTGKITVVVPNHISVFDVEQTLLHEAVGHHGLRELFGEHFDTFLDNVFKNAEPEIRRKIAKMAMRHGFDSRVATEEYLAALAENTDFENVNSGWWYKIKSLFLQMLHKIGFKGFEGVELSDNELRYILWRSYENLAEPGRYRNVFREAADIAKQYELKVGRYAENTPSREDVAEESTKDFDKHLEKGESLSIAPTIQKAGIESDSPLSGFKDKRLLSILQPGNTENDIRYKMNNEKRERIEKLRKSKPVEITGKEIEPSEDLKQYKKNALEYGKKLQGEYTNKDTGLTIQLQRGRKNGGVNEVLQHDYKNMEHLQSVAAIPQIIENSIYIDSAPNTDNEKNPNVTEYQYYVCGLKIGEEDYTVRSTIALDSKGNRYYDHKLTQIEKGRLLDLLPSIQNQEDNQEAFESTSFGTTPGTKPTTSLSGIKDTKLLSILQPGSTESDIRYKKDNEKRERIEKLRRSEPVEITGKEIEPSNDLKQYRKNANAYGLENLRGKYTNKDTGKTIVVAKNSIKEITSHDASPVQFQSVAAIPQIIENGIYVETVQNEDAEKHGDVSSYDYYVCGLKIGGVDYTVKAVVANGFNGERYYDHRLTEIEKGELLSLTTAMQNHGSENSSPLSDFKDKRLLSILQPGSTESEENEEEDKNIRYRKDNKDDEESEDDKESKDSKNSEEGEGDKYKRLEIRDSYEKRMLSSGFQSNEAFLDSMASLKEYMNAVLRASGKKEDFTSVAGFQNPYFGENALSSVNEKELVAMERIVFRPLEEVLAKLCKNKEEYTALVDYMMAKHGLERNEVMARRDAEKAAQEEFSAELRAAERVVKESPKSERAADLLAEVERSLHEKAEALYAENRKRDYSGLTALTEEKEVAEAEAQARQLVAEYERTHETAELWKKVKATSEAILSKSYESGLINKESYNRMKSMYEYYIPLRGFDEKTSNEAYTYLNGKNSAFNAPIKKAWGRNSKADDPIANLRNMAGSAVLQGNRNTLVKQRFLNFVLNHPSDLVGISDLWLKYNDEKQEWEPVFPDFPEKNDAEDRQKEVEEVMREFEERMKALSKEHPERYKHGKDTVDIPYRVVDNRDMHQHQVIVKRGGRDYVLTVNGNPRLAQALNGQTNPDNDLAGSFRQIVSCVGDVNRTLSAIYTTMQPDFMAGNFLRDTLYANSMVWVKEDMGYASRFNVNYAKLNPAKMKILFEKYRKGKLDMKNETERYFKEFLDNGGETGYARLADVEQHKKKIQESIKALNETVPLRTARRELAEWIGEVGRSIESQSRFAAFITSREKGRDVARSVWDAKEISVNFNKKGSGDRMLGAKGQTWVGNASAFTSGMGRVLYVFWNASLQGTFNNFLKNAKAHPAKALAMSASWFSLAMLVSALGASDGDDEDSYYDIPEHTRRTNFVVKGPGRTWLKYPLPIEYRLMYGLGEMFGDAVFHSGRISPGAVLGQLSQALPVDFMAGQAEGDFSLGRPLFPSSVKPLVEAANNVSWTGVPIWKDSPYNKHMPQWTKAYRNANAQLVDLAAVLNEASGGDKYRQGAVDVNPAVVEYLLRGYAGGFWTLPNQLMKMTETALGDREFDWRNVPLLNRMLMQSDERTRFAGINREYYSHYDVFERVQNELRGYRNEAAKGSEVYRKKLNELLESDDYKVYMAFRNGKAQIDRIRELEKMLPESAEEERKDLERRMARLKKEVVERIRELKKEGR